MSILPEYEKLWKPYGGKLDAGKALDWLKKQAHNHSVSPDVADAAFAETMLEVANGKVFPTDGCDCGCELDNPHTALVHYAKRKMLDLGNEAARTYAKILQDRFHAAILNHIHLQNEAFIEEQMPKPKRKGGGKPPRPNPPKDSAEYKPSRLKRAWGAFVYYVFEWDVFEAVRR